EIMSVHAKRNIEALKRSLVSYGTRVEETLVRAVDALVRRDVELAKAVMAADNELDRQEVDIEEECLKILALYQPVAADLRFVVAVLKMNGDLERMGDLAANVAKRTIVLAAESDLSTPVDFSVMADLSLSMVKRSLDALVNGDGRLARAVLADDDKLDDMRREAQNHIIEQIKRVPQRVESLMALSSVYRHLERIGDMATNVCEDVIYMLEGDIVRHSGARLPQD
ncbi:MAG: phosphate signaling complex protein PhoU, partial [Phycisphaerae bacterium]|nr:phosphate signaling complex protein PhoU [Phycisphaerae bacterium]